MQFCAERIKECDLSVKYFKIFLRMLFASLAPDGILQKEEEYKEEETVELEE